MPVTFRDIANNTATLTIKLEGLEDIHVIYYPNKVTDQLLESITNGDLKDNDLLSTLIKSWDIFEDDEKTQMYPVERISDFGIQFKIAVAQAIQEHMRPNTVASQTTLS